MSSSVGGISRGSMPKNAEALGHVEDDDYNGKENIQDTSYDDCRDSDYKPGVSDEEEEEEEEEDEEIQLEVDDEEDEVGDFEDGEDEWHP